MIELLIGCLIFSGMVMTTARAIGDAITTAKAAKAGEWDFLDKDRDRRANRWAKAWEATRRRRHKEAGGDGAYQPGLGAYLGDLYHGWCQDLIDKRRSKRDQRGPAVYNPDRKPWHQRVDDAAFSLGRRVRQRWLTRGNRVDPAAEAGVPADDRPSDGDERLNPDPVGAPGPVVHAGHAFTAQISRSPNGDRWSWVCRNCPGRGFDYPTQEAAEQAARTHDCPPVNANGSVRGPAAERKLQRRSGTAGGPACPGCGQPYTPRRQALMDLRCPECRDKNVGGPSMFAFTCNYCHRQFEDYLTRAESLLGKQSHEEQCPHRSPADTTPSTEGDDVTTTTDASSTATGEAHNVETALNQCDLLGDDLSRIDASLDVVDEAIASAGAATEQLEAYLASKNVDDAAVGGMSKARDMLSPTHIKALIDAVEAAKQGVQATREELLRLQDVEQQLNGADGSVLNGR